MPTRSTPCVRCRHAPQSQAEALKTAEAAYALAQQRYRAGIGSFLEVLSVEEQLLVAQERMTALQSDQILASVKLRQALEGGLRAAARRRACRRRESRHRHSEFLMSPTMSQPTPTTRLPPRAASAASSACACSRVLVIVLIAAVTVWYFMYWPVGSKTPTMPTCKATKVQIALFGAGHRGPHRPPKDGMRVERGQVLVQLDPADTRSRCSRPKPISPAPCAGSAAACRWRRSLAGRFERPPGCAGRACALDFARRKDLAASGAISNEELASHATNSPPAEAA